jgi:hypothetical protein
MNRFSALFLATIPVTILFVSSSCGKGSSGSGSGSGSGSSSGSSSGSGSPNVLGAVSGERFGVNGTPGSLVRLVVPVTGQRDDLGVANAAIDLNGDGSITPDEWLVQNVPVVVAPTTYGFLVEVDDTNLANAAVTVALSAADVTAPWDGSTPAGGVGVTSKIPLPERDLPIPNPPPDPGVGGGSGGGASAPPVPAGGLQLQDNPTPQNPDQVIHPGVPSPLQGDSSGDGNTCVPNAVGSSLAWLARTYGFANGFKNGGTWEGWQTDGGVPDAGPGSANSGVDPLVNDLLTSYTNAGLYTPATGVGMGDIIPGKQAYVNANGLPVQTTRIPCDPNDTSGKGVYDGMKQALKAGCAVEMVVQFPQGKHIVQVVGYKDTGVKQTIYVHDSHNGPIPGQEISDDAFTVSNKTTLLGYPNPNEQQGGYVTATILFAIQECPNGQAATAQNAGAVTCPLSADQIVASFDQSAFTTTYVVGIQNSMAETITTTWTGPNCNTWSPQGPSTSKAQTINATMAWNHAGSANGGNCDHSAPDHTDATIVLTATNGTVTWTCSYNGAATGKGSPCTKQ